jgi:hypothetical protein
MQTRDIIIRSSCCFDHLKFDNLDDEEARNGLTPLDKYQKHPARHTSLRRVQTYSEIPQAREACCSGGQRCWLNLYLAVCNLPPLPTCVHPAHAWLVSTFFGYDGGLRSWLVLVCAFWPQEKGAISTRKQTPSSLGSRETLDDGNPTRWYPRPRLPHPFRPCLPPRTLVPAACHFPVRPWLPTHEKPRGMFHALTHSGLRSCGSIQPHRKPGLIYFSRKASVVVSQLFPFFHTCCNVPEIKTTSSGEAFF